MTDNETPPPAALAAALTFAQEHGIVWVTEETLPLLLSAAVPAIQAEAVAGEREKIAQLADEYDAVYPVDREDTYGGEYQVGVRFAELIREESGND